jgi:hypothetical protein
MGMLVFGLLAIVAQSIPSVTIASDADAVRVLVHRIGIAPLRSSFAALDLAHA